MRKTATSESREPVKLGKHQYFHVPAHVARRHCLAGNIDEPNVAIEALDSVRFFNCRMADMEGVEPPSSFSCEIEGFRSNMSLDSFPDYRSANQAEGGQTPSADAESAVSGSHKPRLPKKKTTSGASWDGRSDRWLRFPRPACPEPSRTDGPEWTFRRRF